MILTVYNNKLKVHSEIKMLTAHLRNMIKMFTYMRCDISIEKKAVFINSHFMIIYVIKMSAKNDNSVIIYWPSCRSKPVRLLFLFGKQMKIFFDEI